MKRMKRKWDFITETYQHCQSLARQVERDNGDGFHDVVFVAPENILSHSSKSASGKTKTKSKSKRQGATKTASRASRSDVRDRRVFRYFKKRGYRVGLSTTDMDTPYPILRDGVDLVEIDDVMPQIHKVSIAAESTTASSAGSTSS